MDHDVHRVFFGDQQRYGIGELKFTSGTGLDAPERVEDRPIQQIAADRGQGGRGLVGCGLLDHATDPLDIVGVGVGDVEAAVGGNLLARHVERAQHAAAVAGAHLAHPLEHAARQHQVVGQQHRDRVVGIGQIRFRTTHGVAQPEGLFLQGGLRGDQRGSAADLIEQFVLAAGLESLFELGLRPEVLGHRLLVRRGHDDQALRTRFGRFGGHQFDPGGVDDR